MKKRLIYKVFALALIMGGLGMANINQSNAFPINPPAKCMHDHRDCVVQCEEWHSGYLEECLEECQEQLDECLDG